MATPNPNQVSKEKIKLDKQTLILKPNQDFKKKKLFVANVFFPVSSMLSASSILGLAEIQNDTMPSQNFTAYLQRDFDTHTSFQLQCDCLSLDQ